MSEQEDSDAAAPAEATPPEPVTATDPAKITLHHNTEIHEVDRRYHVGGVSFATRLEAIRHIQALEQAVARVLPEDETPAAIVYRGQTILRRYEVGSHSFATRAEAARHIDALASGGMVGAGAVTTHRGVEIVERGGRYHVGEEGFATRLDAIRHINRMSG